MRPIQNPKNAPANVRRAAAFFGELTATTTIGLLGSLALFPLVALQGTVTRRRVPCLPPLQPPLGGLVPGAGPRRDDPRAGDR